MFLADYLAQLNDHDEDAGVHGPVHLDEVLQGLRLCMPPSFNELPALTEKARREVPGYYGGPI